MSDIFNLFDRKLSQKTDLIASSPTSLSSISDEKSDQEYAIKKSRSFENVEYKIDYSDFANFVFFNSAEDYFNITGERMLNEYPYDGTIDAVQSFEDSSDGYQRYVAKMWPQNSSHLRFFQPSGSFIKVDDSGKENGSAKTALLSPSTSSFAIETWYRPCSSALATSNTTQFLFQKINTAGTGYSLFLSASSVYFRVTSGSVTTELSAPINDTVDSYVAASVDRSSLTGTISLMTGSSARFPTIVASSSVGFYTPLDIGNASFYIGSGTLSSKTTALFTGTIGEIRVWKKPRTLQDISSSFNTKIFAQKDLIGLWNFNETGSIGSGPASIVYDKSGHKLDGRIQNYYSGLRNSGSLVIDSVDYILNFDAPEVRNYILEQQNSGSAFDRASQTIITNYFAESFFIEEEKAGTEVLKNFLYVAARMFDEIKVSIDHFSKIHTVNYTEFNQAPDALLSQVAEFYGWNFAGNFISADAFQFLLGKNVLSNLDANINLDTKMWQIKNELWRRVLNNLSYIYKAKGTRESVEALLRSYGVRNNLFRIKEYATDYKTGLSVQRITTEKSVKVTTFGSSSLTASVYRDVTAGQLSGSDHTIEARVMFPLTSSADLPATISSGTIWTLGSNTTDYYSLVYQKDSFSSRTGSFFLTSSVGLLAQLTGVGVFDGTWQNISTDFSYTSGTVNLSIRNTSFGEIKDRFSSSSAAPGLRNLLTSSLITRAIAGSPKIVFGTTFDTWRYAQYWMQEFKVWSLKLVNNELDDHALNFQSYGLNTQRENGSGLLQHWRLDQDVTASVAATNGNQFFWYDIASSPSLSYVTGTNFSSSTTTKKVLNEYSYIGSPDMGWTDEKIRVIDGTKQRFYDTVSDSSVIGVEFNMIDAVNEDIIQLMSSFDELNSILGTGATKYQESYNKLPYLRQRYFKRLQGKLNFRIFSDMLEFFDRSFMVMIEKLIPARAKFLGDEFVIESHMLERPKFQYGRFVEQETVIDIEGVIRMTGTGSIRFAPGTVSLKMTSMENTSDISGIAMNRSYSVTPRSVKG